MMDAQKGATLQDRIGACRICAQAFAATPSGHEPRPVVWFQGGARLLLAGQAPGRRVHLSGQPFTDPSGDRLRRWLGLTPEQFYDRSRVAILPMAFCFPGQTKTGADLPPPPVCAATWRAEALAEVGRVNLCVLLGGAAIRWHLGRKSVGEAVADWRKHAAEGVFPLPHPSWRTTAWESRTPWFGTELLPALQDRVRHLMEAGHDGS